MATRFIDYFNTTIQFQSTLAYLKNPPTGYQQPAVDVQARLQQIQNNITAGNYHDEYVFEADFQLLIQSMHDAHVAYNGGALSAFTFSSPMSILSASKDGKQVPQIWATDDVLESASEGWTPSPITKINGEDVVEYLTKFAAINSQGYLEPHADWNAIMSSPALDIQGQVEVFFGGALLYPGDGLNFTFANGSEIDTYWLALYSNPDPTGPLTTGGDFYNYFVLGNLPASYVDPNTTVGTLVDTQQAANNWSNQSYGAYPQVADVFQPDLSIIGGGIVTGYYLKDISTGVLSLPSFEQSGWDIGNFSDTVSRFIQGAKDANLQHIVIDVQQNAGGDVVLALTTFRQFFPEIDPFGGSRRRSHALGNVLGSATTKYWDSLPVNGPDYEFLLSDEWVITPRINAATGKNFTSWEEYAGPVLANGDAFSLTERFNLSSVDIATELFAQWIPYGFANNPVTTTRPWQPQDVVILTDGLCSSACALFAEMMVHEAGARTIAVGGRPVTGPMQAVSGTRGAAPYAGFDLDNDFSYASSINDTAKALLPQVRDTAISTTFEGFNLRDQIRKGDTTPLQFKYEAADCRIYYTLANVYNTSQLWRDAARATWTDSSLCVTDSTGYPSARADEDLAKAPPAPTAQLATYEFATSQHTPLLTSNSTTGLTDGKTGASSGVFTICNPATAGSANGVCRQVPLSCGNGQPINPAPFVLLPNCNPTQSQQTSCNGVNSFCDPTVLLESKAIKPVNGKQGSAGTGSLPQQYKGQCTPKVGTKALGCPF